MQKSLIHFFLILFSFNISLTASVDRSIDKVRSDRPISIFDRLSEKDVLEISVRTDIGKLLLNKKSSTYQGAYIKFADATDTDPEWMVQIKARGKYRNKVCEFPPLKVKFDHSVLGPENLKAYKSLKLVTHCGDQAELEELLLREYLAYKMYNTITENSFRVQLVKINWMDSEGTHEIGSKWGFLIENEDEMAERLGGGVYEEYGVKHSDLNTQSAAQNSLFQYMIGNADWDLLESKNICLVKSNSSRDITIVPYDFDFSGVVDAYYGVSQYDVTSMQERIYLGESSEADIAATAELFKTKKKEILELVNSFVHLSRPARNDIKKYIKSFYLSLDKPLITEQYYQDRLVSIKASKKS